MLRFMVIAITLCLAISVPAQALTLAQGVKLEKFLEINSKELGQSNENLLSMTSGLNGLEEIAATRVYDRSAIMDQHQFMKLYVVVSIYTKMIDSRDQATVRKFVGIFARGAVTSANSALDSINRDVVKLSSPAAIAEVQKIRDLIQKIRDEIQRAFPAS